MNKNELRALAEQAAKNNTIQKIPMRRSDRISHKKWWSITRGTEKVNIDKLVESYKPKPKKA